ncbi:MAG TPA: response regulator transcription factor [Elusimicrobiota bacterium]|nr:response regulator transcription factor [Elusimicrobiota bacterium]
MKKKILVVDDDVQLCQLASDILEEHGYQALTANNTDEGFKKLYEARPDLIILDVWLPSIGGLEFCRQVRLDEQTRHIPIIMLTVQDKEMDKVMGLEMGADDYMTKPFGQRELLARIKALFRRFDRAMPEAKLLRSGDLLIDMDMHVVKVKNRSVPMTPKEFDLLVTLIQNHRKAMNRQNLLTSVWGYDAPATTGTIDVHIRHLRRKLGSHGKKIKTILGFGYRFDG